MLASISTVTRPTTSSQDCDLSAALYLLPLVLREAVTPEHTLSRHYCLRLRQQTIESECPGNLQVLSCIFLRRIRLFIWSILELKLTSLCVVQIVLSERPKNNITAALARPVYEQQLQDMSSTDVHPCRMVD